VLDRKQTFWSQIKQHLCGSWFSMSLLACLRNCTICFFTLSGSGECLRGQC
jgi:hypothetical protein